MRLSFSIQNANEEFFNDTPALATEMSPFVVLMAHRNFVLQNWTNCKKTLESIFTESPTSPHTHLGPCLEEEKSSSGAKRCIGLHMNRKSSVYASNKYFCSDESRTEINLAHAIKSSSIKSLN